eukprot:10831625-Alexandrium_andersonii.AAC.1
MARKPHPQSAMRNMHHRSKRSNLALHGPRVGLKFSTWSSRGVRSAALLALIPNLPTKAGLEGGSEVAKSPSCRLQSAMLQSAI